MKKGFIFVISAPAGTGKTTLVKMLCDEFQNVKKSISFTTRPSRAGELEGRDYHFISKRAFEEKIEKSDFLEYAKVFDHYYGTSKSAVEKELQGGKHVVLVIDTQGAMKVQKMIDGVFVFISPPNLEELKKRLKVRKSEDESAMEMRLSWAAKEMSLIPKYNYHIVNDHLKIAYDALRSILIAEEHKVR